MMSLRVTTNVTVKTTKTDQDYKQIKNEKVAEKSILAITCCHVSYML